MKTVKVQLSYYGNKDYGKRVYLITESPIHGKFDFVWVHDFEDWKKEMESDGYEIIVID